MDDPRRNRPLREKMASMKRTSISLALVVAVLATACTGTGGTDASPAPVTSGPSFSAQVASSDLYVGAPQRFLIGIFGGNADGIRFLSYGQIDLAFSFLGDGTATPKDGPTAKATYVGAPGSTASGTSPTLTLPSVARGVYQAENITFDQAGTWQATATAQVGGVGPTELTAAFPVVATPAIPAPGQKALKTKNLTMASIADGQPPAAVDSRGADGQPIPDKNLHQWTVADANAQGKPALVTIATPVYCTSQFCGPVVDEVEKLSQRFADRAVFIHIEVWHDYDKKEINQAAADWVMRNDDLTEPWVFLIGADGKILDRWGALWDPEEVAGELAALPAMS
jgi:hypothetical protein